jgi:hypothetical protein
MSKQGYVDISLRTIAVVATQVVTFHGESANMCAYPLSLDQTGIFRQLTTFCFCCFVFVVVVVASALEADGHIAYECAVSVVRTSHRFAPADAAIVMPAST